MTQRKMERRRFIQTGLVGMAGLPVLANGDNTTEKTTTGKKPKEPITRVLGKTGIRLPVVSMGVMNADNPNLVRAALDSGIVHLDTAHYYQRGRNEEMIGEVIKGRPRDSFVIATKVPGMPMDRQTGLFTAETSGDALLEKFAISLKRLGLEYVEILYLHNVWKREATLFEPLILALQKAKKSGQARFIGVSTHQNEAEVIHAAVDSKVYDVVLTAYNFREDHYPETKKAIARAAAAGLGIVAMKPLAGLYWDEEKTRPINTKAALKWVLEDPNVHTAIPGMTAFEHLNEDLEVMTDITMTAEEKAALIAPPELAGFYCQHCGQCLAQCPHNMPIPSLMRGYMYAHAYRNYAAAQDLVLSLEVPADSCGQCEPCAVRCAKGFAVKERIRNIVQIQNVAAAWFA